MLCKYLSEFYLFLLIALLAFPWCLPLVACLASWTATLWTAVGSNAWLLWEGKYLAFLEFFSKLNRRRWADCLIVGLRKEKRKAGSRLKLCFMLWVLSHFSCEHPFYLTPAHCTVTLQAMASDRRWLRRHTLLVRLQEAFHSARRQVPGPTCRARCQAAYEE